MSEPMLRVQGLKKYFGRHDRPVRAVDDVSFDIAPGEVLGLVGESGSGKSTIGRALLKLVEPSAGSIRFEGVDLAPLSARAMRPYRRRLQIIFQDPYASLNPRRRVGATLAEALATHGLHAGPARAARIAELQVVEHAEFAEQFALLGHQTQAALDAGLDVEPVQVLAFELQQALARQQAHRRGQQRGLAGAVGADHRDDLAVFEAERYAAHRVDLAVGHVQVADFQHRCSGH